MVGQVKRCLGKSLGSSRLTSVQLQTLLTEVQRAINTRALLYAEADHKTSTLSPADFLHMNTSLGVPITTQMAMKIQTFCLFLDQLQLTIFCLCGRGDRSY